MQIACFISSPWGSFFIWMSECFYCKYLCCFHCISHKKTPQAYTQSMNHKWSFQCWWHLKYPLLKKQIEIHNWLKKRGGWITNNRNTIITSFYLRSHMRCMTKPCAKSSPRTSVCSFNTKPETLILQLCTFWIYWGLLNNPMLVLYLDKAFLHFVFAFF